jgi:ankyrin repeat protein
MLLDRGAPIDARNEWGWTPLFFAVTRRHPDVADLLLRRGANPNARSRSGTTPLSEAWGDAEAQALLRRYGGR